MHLESNEIKVVNIYLTREREFSTVLSVTSGDGSLDITNFFDNTVTIHSEGLNMLEFILFNLICGSVAIFMMLSDPQNNP